MVPKLIALCAAYSPSRVVWVHHGGLEMKIGLNSRGILEKGAARPGFDRSYLEWACYTILFWYWNCSSAAKKLFQAVFEGTKFK